MGHGEPFSHHISPLLYVSVTTLMRLWPAFSIMPLQNKQDQLLRARMIVQKVILEGKTHTETAKEMGISHDTVSRGLAMARKAKIYVDYEQKLYDELVPLAHEAVKMGLEDGNAELGLKILQGVNIVKTKNPAGPRAQEDEDSLYGEIAKLRDGSVIDVSPTQPTGTTADDLHHGLLVGGVHGVEENTQAEGENRPADAHAPVEGAEEWIIHSMKPR